MDGWREGGREREREREGEGGRGREREKGREGGVHVGHDDLRARGARARGER
jgi:hypothetical protein